MIGDDLSSIASGPTVPDKTKFSDVELILKKYDLWKSLPNSIKSHIELGKKIVKWKLQKKVIYLTMLKTLLLVVIICV